MRWSTPAPVAGQKGSANLSSTVGLLVLLILSASVGVVPTFAQVSENHAVYLRVADRVEMPAQEVGQRLEGVIEEAGWNLLAAFDVAAEPDACAYDARVLVVDWPAHTAAVLSRGFHGAFAAPIRIAVFEDEEGTHIGVTNPLSLNRTIAAEEGMEADWREFAHGLKSTLASGLGQRVSQIQYGQFREKGLIGKTMGVMAGGPFEDKIETIVSLGSAENSVAGVTERLYKGLQSAAEGPDWGLKPVYSFSPEGHDVGIIGISGAPMEMKAFSIVGAGANKRRKDMSCPGLDHAPAFPIELVVYVEGDVTKVALMDEMYRMKMYFEDAGKMKFARNMRMPGSIEDEIRSLVRGVLNP